MNCKELLSEFCERRGGSYDPAGGSGAVEVGTDGGPVLVVPDFERDELTVLATVGEPPEGGEAGRYERRMLEENFRLAATGGAYLSFDSGTGSYVAAETVSSARLDAGALQGVVDAVAGLRNRWQGSGAEWRPPEAGGFPVGEGIIRG